jgi:2-keto-4-pentenoate hydratase/2-oxohepta-3-ene-1,7-dioic acid hydratase in catechol pathway
MSFSAGDWTVQLPDPHELRKILFGFVQSDIGREGEVPHMKMTQFASKQSNRRRLGVLIEGKLIDVAALAQAVRRAGGQAPDRLLEVRGTAEIIEHGAAALDDVRLLIEQAKADPLLLKDDVIVLPESMEFLPPVFPGKILAIGRNYVDHAIEQGEEPPSAPLIFNKLSNSLNAHNAPIVLPSISAKVDYEAELAVIIGRRASRVAEAEALEYVFGYSPLNDVSARDLQFGDGQWTRGKGLDGFAPLGPFITTRDEIEDVQKLKIEGRLNGEVMQSSNTGKMIFKVAYLVSYLSQGITLEAGDVIATGTPEGVGIFRNPPVLLKPGDVYEVTIEKLGTLRSSFVRQEELAADARG